MTTPENECRIDYLEFPVSDIKKTKEFYSTVFGWTFEDYGPNYTSFVDGRLAGGFFTEPQVQSQVRSGGPLVVIYTTDLQGMHTKVVAAGGKIVRPEFEFPGGRRFHFTDPSGNELALWTNV